MDKEEKGLGEEVAADVSALEHALQQLGSALEQTVGESKDALKQVSALSVEYLECFNRLSGSCAAAVETAVAQAQSFVMKCTLLDRQLSKLDRYEAQLAAAKSMLSAVEKAVKEKCSQVRAHR